MPVNKSAGRAAVEAVLQAAGMTYQTVREIAAKTGMEEANVARVINNLNTQKTLHSQRRGSAAGYVLASIYAKTLAVTATETPIKAGTSTGTYIPHELAPYTGREGAMDAFKLPSLVNGQRVERKAPALVCVGVAGPMNATHGQVRFAK